MHTYIRTRTYPLVCIHTSMHRSILCTRIYYSKIIQIRPIFMLYLQSYRSLNIIKIQYVIKEMVIEY